MKLLLLSFCFLTQYSLFGQGQEFRIKEYFGSDSVFEFATNRIDTIRKLAVSNKEFVMDSLESYQNDKLNGPKILFGGAIFLYEYVNDSLISQKIYGPEQKLLFSSPLDSTLLEKTVVHLKSNLSYLRRSTTDTIEVINKTLPEGNFAISAPGAWLSKLGAFSFLIRIKESNHEGKEVVVRLDIIIDQNENNPVSKTESFIFPIK